MKLYKHRSKSTKIMNELITRLIVNRQICFLLLIVWATMSISASAYMMPIDQLMQLSNQQLSAKAQMHWDKNELDSALICYNIVANRADQSQSKEDMKCVISATATMANIYLAIYDYERATQCLLKAEQIAKTHPDKVLTGDIYALMATLESEKLDIQQDFAFNREAFDLHRKAFHQYLVSSAPQRGIYPFINMTALGLMSGRLNMIQDELNCFMKLSFSDSIPVYHYARHLCIAAINVNNRRYDSALQELNKLEQSLDMMENHKPLYRTLAHECKFYVYRDIGDKERAMSELDSLEMIAQANKLKFTIIAALLLKRDYYTAQGFTKLAHEYDLKFHKAKDEFMAEAKVAKVEEEKVLFKLNEANHEIKELSYQQRIQQTELIAVAVVAVLLLALLVLAWMSHRRTKEKNRSLYLQNQQLLANIDRVRQLRQEQERQAQEATPAVKYGRGKMEGDDISQVMAKVERIMDESEEIYSAGFSLDRLAELTGETESRVSQAINTSGRKFYELLNEYRVREACRRMDDKTHSSGLTIEAIGQSVGFRSRSNFVSTFKRLTGLTPSAYLKQPHDGTPPSLPPESN